VESTVSIRSSRYPLGNLGDGDEKYIS